MFRSINPCARMVATGGSGYPTHAAAAPPNTCSRTACEASNFTRAAEQLQGSMFGVAATVPGSREGGTRVRGTIHCEMLSVKSLTSEHRDTGVPTHEERWQWLISINQWVDRILFTLAVTNQTNPGYKALENPRKKSGPTDGKSIGYMYTGKGNQRGNSRCYATQVIADCLHVRPLIYRKDTPKRDRQQLVHYPWGLFQAGYVSVKAVCSPPFPVAHLNPVSKIDRAGLA